MTSIANILFYSLEVMGLRNAATVLITIPKKCRFGFNYGVVMLRRTGRSNYVFPGGVLEQSDADLQSLFSDKQLRLKPNGPRSPIYDAENRDFSLRIAGIRETFEESGILLLEKHGDWINASHLPGHVRVMSRLTLSVFRMKFKSGGLKSVLVRKNLQICVKNLTRYQP